jgi:cell division protein FtsB
MFSSSAMAETSDLIGIENRLQQQERRIDQLERTVEALQNHLMELENGIPAHIENSRSMDTNTIDPLVGTWECTNNVFKYDISFFADGHLIQEEPFFSMAKNSRWTRMSENRFVTDQGFSFTTDFQSVDILTVTNMNNQSAWYCTRTR